MMKALVIGGNGFIGSHLVDALVRQGWDVVVLSRHERRYGPMPPEVEFIRGDYMLSFFLKRALADVDVVFHLAWTTIHEVSNQDLVADVYAHLVPSLQLMEACLEAGVKRLIFTSSGGTVYGPAQQLPIPESHPRHPINGYGVAKVTIENYLHMFHHIKGLEYAVLRPSVPYGPRQNPLGRQGAVAVFLHRVAHELPITIWGDGTVTRDYFYITDLVNALIRCATQTLGKSRIFNIGGQEEISLNKLIAHVEKTVAKKAVVTYEAARSFDAPRIVLDTTLAEKELNWQPNVSFSDGLAQTWDWMSSHF